MEGGDDGSCVHTVTFIAGYALPKYSLSKIKVGTCYKGVTNVLQGCYKGDTRVLRSKYEGGHLTVMLVLVLVVVVGVVVKL
jgi:hypothetical protein